MASLQLWKNNPISGFTKEYICQVSKSFFSDFRCEVSGWRQNRGDWQPDRLPWSVGMAISFVPRLLRTDRLGHDLRKLDSDFQPKTNCETHGSTISTMFFHLKTIYNHV